MPGTSPGMTNSGESAYFIDRILSQTLRMRSEIDSQALRMRSALFHRLSG
jgi:hypothetical protein